MTELVAIDVETDSTNPHSTNLKMVGVAGQGIRSEYYLYPDQRDTIKAVLATPTTKVGHNIKFDIEVLRRHGIEVGGTYDDTLILSQLYGRFTGDTYGLKELAKQVLNIDSLNFKELLAKYNPNVKKKDMLLSNIPAQVLGEYCVKDCELTLKLYDYLMGVIDGATKETYETIERPLLKNLLEIESQGMLIDRNKLAHFTAELEEYVKFLQRYVWAEVGEAFNLNPSADLESVLFEGYKCPIIKVNPNGRPCTDDKVLQRLRWGGFKIAGWILEYRKLSKLLTTYCKAFTRSMVDDRIYPSLSQTGTDTGRFSSQNPNMQNVPPEMRSAFVARIGYKLVAIDYSQMEYVVGACLVNDESLIDMFNSGGNIHDYTAAQFQVDRKKAKTINFGLFYGQTPFGLCKSLKCKLEEAESIVIKLHNDHPNIREFGNSQVDKLLAEGYIETMFGRRRYIDITKMGKKMSEKKLRQRLYSQAINTPVQGTCADIIKMAMNRCCAAGYIPLLQIHDELLFEVEESKAEQVAESISKIMTGVFEGQCKLNVEVKIGDNWGDLS